jgi:hypothetical protein
VKDFVRRCAVDGKWTFLSGDVKVSGRRRLHSRPQSGQGDYEEAINRAVSQFRDTEEEITALLLRRAGI